MVTEDVTNKVRFLNNDDEYLPIVQCICGKKFNPWDFIISIYPTDPTECPKCSRKLFFKLNIQVFEIMEEKNELQPR